MSTRRLPARGPLGKRLRDLRPPAFAAVLLVLQSVVFPARAEPLALGPFTPKVTLYGTSIDPVVNFQADVATKRDGLYAKGNILVSVPAADINSKLSAISKRLLPVEVPADRCRFEIQSISDPTFTVVSNTGDFKVDAYVVPQGCPLVSGSVSLHVRFAPAVVKSILSIKIASLEVKVPSEWWWIGKLAGKDPATLIAAELKKRVEAQTFSMPPIDHVRAALQGASLDSKAGNVIILVRSDAQIDGSAVTDALSASGLLAKLSYTYP
jgi:hypothetical protein